MVLPEILGLIATMGLAGAIAGVTAGLFGVGGGFVIVPALLAVFPWFSDAPEELIYVAIGTSLASIVVSSARAVQAHRQRGAVDFGVLKDWCMWLLLGVGVIDRFQSESVPGLFSHVTRSLSMPRGATRAGLASFLGGFSALLGIGGGTVTVMTMVMCNRPVHQAVATAAGVGFIIGLPGALGFLILGLGVEGLPYGSVGYINVPALVAISALSVFTAPVGARWAHSLDEVRLKRLFGIYLVLVSLAMYYKSLSV